jgi:hypothetical protein
MQVHRQLNIRQVNHTGCHKVTMTAPCVVHKDKGTSVPPYRYTKET